MHPIEFALLTSQSDVRWGSWQLVLRFRLLRGES